MKIFQVITVSEYGGAQTIVADLIRNLSPEHEVFILYGGEGESWAGLGNNFTRIRLCKHRKSVSLKDVIVLLKLFYYRIKYRPDVVHLHSSKMGALGRIAFNPAKIVYTVHGFDSVRKAFPQFIRVEKVLKNRARYIVGVSRYDVNCLKEEGIGGNVMCIYNGVDDYCGQQNKLDPALVNKLTGIRGKYPHIIMCIARISKQKKFDLFVDIAKAMPHLAFVWIGNKEEIAGLPENVFCMGETHAAYNYFRFADVFILPSNYEGLPMSLLEALSFRLPAVASAVGGIPEVLDGENGFSVNNIVSEFKEKIEYIISDPDRYNLMAECARQTYIANFTIGKMVDNYLSAYNKITAGKQ